MSLHRKRRKDERQCLGPILVGLSFKRLSLAQDRPQGNLARNRPQSEIDVQDSLTLHSSGDDHQIGPSERLAICAACLPLAGVAPQAADRRSALKSNTWCAEKSLDQRLGPDPA